MFVSFESLDDDDQGIFGYSGDYSERVVDIFDEALDRRDSGGLDNGTYVAILERLVEEERDFIDGHAHLAFAWYDQGKLKKALEASLRGLAVGNRLIPEGFTGRIDWTHLDNRPFLRALHGAALTYAKLHRHHEAVAMMERLLAYNPNDNQGIRYLLGSEYLRVAEMDKAQQLLEAERAYYPPYQYEFALLHLQTGNWISAATALRRGFCANLYIAEILCGNPNPAQLAIWHGSNLDELGCAYDYLAMYGNSWRDTPDFVAFLHWLYNNSRVLAERAAFLSCMEELLWEKNVQHRGNILSRLEAVMEGIDDRLSAELVVERVDHTGQRLFPWRRFL